MPVKSCECLLVGNMALVFVHLHFYIIILFVFRTNTKNHPRGHRKVSKTPKVPRSVASFAKLAQLSRGC